MSGDLLLSALEDEIHAFRPLTSKSPHQLVADQFRQHINFGWWPEGTKIPPERELAAELNVSRETVRQALNLLEDEGEVLRPGPRTGAAVAVKTPDMRQRRAEIRGRMQEFEDLHDLRRLIESSAARRAAENYGQDLFTLARSQRELRSAHLALMTKAQGQLRTALVTGSADRFRAADTDFHLAVCAASGNAAVRDTVRRIRSAMFAALDTLIDDGNELALSIEEHEAILEAIAAGKPDLAAQHMEAHLDRTNKAFHALLADGHDAG